MDKEVDLPGTIFCSIGENCLGQGILDRKCVASCVTPFSWARSNVDYLLQIVNEDFNDFLNPKFLHHRSRYGKTIATNSKYTCASGVFEQSVANEFEFTHHDVLSSPKDLASLQRKVTRFGELIRSDAHVVFLYHHRYQPKSKQQIGYVMDRLNIFHNLVKKLRHGPSDVLCFTQEIINDIEDRGVSATEVGTSRLALLRTKEVWGGNNPDVFWGKVDDDLFDQIILPFSNRFESDLVV